ncbi:uncharacterized protein LOC129409711 [Boleophthalmus pectinirostris]|uniref:uncharacterized protein LOC129409711 n=1 Tax=Boleophthalmus pectinirostris TaxID=150288 RepID=UPI00242FD2BA|nr:uncharacterized protein LOC129409711 [Boleophthalmus pectinirostris]
MLFKVVAVILLWSHVEAQLQFGLFQKVRLGNVLHVNCEVNKDWVTLVWYKLDTNRRLQKIAIEFRVSGLIFKNKHYSLKSHDTGSTLTVADVTWEDAGTYYCGIYKNDYIDFRAGTVVVVEGESRSRPSVLQSPDYIRVQPGDSVTLSCSFNTSLCPEEDTSVTWAKSTSASQMSSWNPRITTMFCEKSDIGETSCVHKVTLTWKDFSSAGVGTYVCVVTVCGHTLLGTGTRIKQGNEERVSPAAVVLILVCVAFAVTVLLLLRLIRKNKTQTTEVERDTHRSPEDYEAEESHTYAQVNRRPAQAPAELLTYSVVRISRAK